MLPRRMRADCGSNEAGTAAGAATAGGGMCMSMGKTSGERERAEPAGRSLSTRLAQTLRGRPLPLTA